MLFYLLCVAMLNLALGYALALVLGHRRPAFTSIVSHAMADSPPTISPPAAMPLSLPVSSEATGAATTPASLPDEPLPDESSESRAEATEAPTEAPAETITEIATEPADRMETPSEDAAPPREKSPTESSVDDFLDGLQRFREHISQIDNRLRGCAKNRDVEALEECVEALRRTSHCYLEETEQRAQRIPAPPEGSDELDPVGQRLRSVADSQVARLRSAGSQLADLDVNHGFDGPYRKIITHTTELISLSAHFQQQLKDTQLTLARQGEEIEPSAPRMLVDRQTDLPTRAALEAALEEQWRRDPARNAMQLVALIDIDHSTQIDQQQGQPVCDRLLKTVGQLICEATPNSLVTRYGGQKYSVLFTGDAPSQAIAAVERIRQTLETTHFEHQGFPLHVTANCVLARVKEEDTLESLFTRLMHTLGESKQYGRNCTFIDEGNAPTSVMPAALETFASSYGP